MSAHTPTLTSFGGRPEPEMETYLNHAHGWKSWAFTLDHKRIALMYMVAILTAFLIGGIFALLLRTELIATGPTLVSNPTVAWDLYNNLFTLHGVVMVFMFIVPSIPAIMGNFILPLQLGAKDVAFPRLNLASFYIYCLGGLFMLYVLLSGVIHAASNGSITLPGGFGLDTGWTFYTPYSTAKSMSSVVPATFGAFILGFSSILTGVNFIASIHSLRPKGMSWFRMPLFLWAMYSVSIIQILATPVLAITLLLLICERTLGVGIFDPALGGDPVLYQHFFWFYSHPAVYIMILPGMGVISELIGTFSRKHLFGYNFVAASSVAIALLGFLVWGHHLFVSGQSMMAGTIFSVFSFAVAIPSGIKVFNWTATLYGGSIRLKTPMLYALGFLVLFSIGGLTGIWLACLGADVHLHDTYFVVSHFHYVMVGSMLFAFIGGFYYWWPKMFGKMYSERWAIIAMILVFIGFNLTFFPQLIAGTHGLPRRQADYLPQFWIYMFLSSIGAYILAGGLFLVLFNWIHSLKWGEKAPANPWGANTLEWHTTSPPPYDNFPDEPYVGDPYDITAWHYDKSKKAWLLDPKAATTRSGMEDLIQPAKA